MITPGPWAIFEDQVIDLERNCVAEIPYPPESDEHDCFDRQRANLNAIRAVPELLKTLRKVRTLARFKETDGSMDLGERLLEIEQLAHDTLMET